MANGISTEHQIYLKQHLVSYWLLDQTVDIQTIFCIQSVA